MSVHCDFEHDVQTVYETLTDPQFLVDRCMAMGELGAECEVEENEEATSVHLVREIRRNPPRILAKVFDPVQFTEMTEQWQPGENGWHGNWTMQVRGQPITIMGSFELLGTPGGCRYSVSHQVRANVPLLGGRIEKYILGQASGGATDELTYLKQYLG